MIAVFEPSLAKGTITAPPSKSMAHRLLICAGLCRGKSRVGNVALSRDIQATLDCLRALGVAVEIQADSVRICGVDARSAVPSSDLFCGESGSTLRFFIPICLLTDSEITLRGREALLRRPLNVYEDICQQRGLLFAKTAAAITVRGPLGGGEYTVSSDISSQFVSGLLFALPLLDQDSRISLLPPVVSRPYIDMTIRALACFGVKASWLDENTISMPGRQSYSSAAVQVEGDYSNAAFFQALDLLGGKVTVTGLDPESIQGDKVCTTYFEQLKKGPAVIDITDNPDLGPVLMAVAAALHGGTLIGTKRLRLKESDRARSMQDELRKFGATVDVAADSVTVHPADLHAPSGILDGHNDHRVVMALSVLAAKYGGRISGAETVAKSMPDFFDALRSLDVRVTTKIAD